MNSLTLTPAEKRAAMQAECGETTAHKNCYLAGDWFWTCRSCGHKIAKADA